MRQSLNRTGWFLLVFTSVIMAGQSFATSEFLSPGDVNGDGVVNRWDIFSLIKGFDPHGVTLPTEADRNGDRLSDQRDLSLILHHWQHERPHSEVLPPDPTQCGSVEGHVYIVGQEGDLSPVSGAVVVIPGPWTNNRTRTDASGHFVFENVLSGTQEIWAHYDGFFPDRKTIAVEVGQATLVDLVLTVDRPDLGVIAGIVRVDSGIMDCGGRADCVGPPIPGATVRLIPLEITPPFDYEPYEAANLPDFEHRPGHPTAEQSVQTDERGFYFFSDIPVGQYQVLVMAFGFEPAGRGVEVVEAERTIADFDLIPIPEGCLFGQATDGNTGNPIKHASIGLFPIPTDTGTETQPGEQNGDPDALPPITDGHVPPIFALTDEDGWYKIPRMPAGDFHAVMRAQAYEPAEADVYIAPATQTQFDFQLFPKVEILSEIRGTVYGVDGPPDPAVSVASPIEGATLYLVAGGDIPQPLPMMKDGEYPETIWDPSEILAEIDVSNILRIVTSDVEGNYSFGDVRPSCYRILARAEGYQTGRQKTILFPGQIQIIDFYLMHLPPITYGALQGNVYEQSPEAAGEPAPVSGALVIAEPWNFVEPPPRPTHDSEPAGPVDDRVAALRTPTNEEGFFLFPELRTGSYRVRVLAEEFLPAVVHTHVAAGQTTDLDVYLQPVPAQAGRVIGQVFEIVDPAGGGDGPSIPVPIPGARVILKPILAEKGSDSHADEHGDANDAPEFICLKTFTNDRGYYEFPRVPGGAYRIESNKEGYGPVSFVVNVESGEVTVQDFQLSPNQGTSEAWIRGGVYARIENESLPVGPWPIEGAFVFLIPHGRDLPELTPDALDMPGIRREVTGDSGRYGFENVEPGKYILLAIASGFEPDLRRLEVNPEDNLQSDFFLVPIGESLPARMSGYVFWRCDCQTFAPAVIEGALVRMVPNMTMLPPDGGNNDGSLFSAELPVYEALTNQNGFYEIPDIVPGEYQVEVTKEGYLSAFKVIALAPDAQVELHFALESPSAESSLKGTVLQADGSSDPGLPISGARIVLVRGFIEGPIGDAVLTTISAEDGTYSFAGLRFGMYHVTVEAQGYAPVFETIEIQPGEERILDFNLRSMQDYRPGRVRGTVLGQGSTAGETVLIGPARVSLFLSNGMEPLTTVTDRSGTYSIDNVPPEECVILAEAEGYLPKEQAITIPSGDELIVDFILEPNPENSSLSGYVLEASPDSTVQIPIVGAKVALILQGGTGSPVAGMILPMVYEAISDENGFYNIPEVSPGFYTVHVGAEGYGPVFESLEMPAGTELSQDWYLPRRPGEGNTFISGFVSEDTGMLTLWIPIAGAQVILHNVAGMMLRTAFTDENGAYRIDNLVPGRYRAVVLAPGYHPKEETIDVPTEGNDSVGFRLARIDRPAFVSGNVTEDVGMLDVWIPIPGARISLFGPSGTAPVVVFTNMHGEYRMDGTAPGVYRLKAEANGYLPREKEITIPGEGLPNVNFSLLKAGTEGTAVFKGEVRGDSAGRGDNSSAETTPVIGATVKLFQFNPDGTSSLVYETTTGEDGGFEFPEIRAPRPYHVKIIADHFYTLEDKIEVGVGDVLSRSYFLTSNRWKEY